MVQGYRPGIQDTEGGDHRFIYRYEISRDYAMTSISHIFCFGVNELLLRFDYHRQEMPLHRHGLDPRSHSHWQSRLNEDAPNSDHPPRIPPFRSQILPIREETFQPRCTRQPSLPRGRWRYGHGGTMQTSEQDGESYAGLPRSFAPYRSHLYTLQIIGLAEHPMG